MGKGRPVVRELMYALLLAVVLLPGGANAQWPQREVKVLIGFSAGGTTDIAKPDGHTLMMGSVGPLAINASLYRSMPYAPKAMQVNTFPEFVALLKANPGKYFYASTGNGTSSHLSGELLKLQAAVNITHVPYKGAVAVNDLRSGESVHFMFATIPSVINHVRSGRLRALAVTGAKRSAGVPELPAVAESGFPGFDASSWFGLVATVD